MGVLWDIFGMKPTAHRSTNRRPPLRGEAAVSRVLHELPPAQLLGSIDVGPRRVNTIGLLGGVPCLRTGVVKENNTICFCLGFWGVFDFSRRKGNQKELTHYWRILDFSRKTQGC